MASKSSTVFKTRSVALLDSMTYCKRGYQRNAVREVVKSEVRREHLFEFTLARNHKLRFPDVKLWCSIIGWVPHFCSGSASPQCSNIQPFHVLVLR